MPGNNEKTHFFDTDRAERAYYEAAARDEQVYLPLTRDGLEALAERCAKEFNPPLPVDDSIRSVLCGYVHRLSNETNQSSIEVLATIMYKSISNALTYVMDQEIKEKNRLALEKQKAEAQATINEESAREAVAVAESKRVRKGKLKVVSNHKNN